MMRVSLSIWRTLLDPTNMWNESMQQANSKATIDNCLFLNVRSSFFSTYFWWFSVYWIISCGDPSIDMKLLMSKVVFLYLNVSFYVLTTTTAVKTLLIASFLGCALHALCCRLEELNEKKDSMVQRVKVAEKEKTGLEVRSSSIKLLSF